MAEAIVSADYNYVTYGQDNVYPPPPTTASSSTETVLFGPWRQRSAGNNYDVRNTCLRFNTGAILPDDAVVMSCVLRVYGQDCLNFHSRNLTADYPTIITGVYTDDYRADGDVANFSAGTVAINNVPLSTFSALPTTPQSYDIALSNITKISPTSNTYLRLCVDGGQLATNGANYLTFVAIDHATLTEPRLVIQYEQITPVRLAPDVILSQSNLLGDVTAIQDDPDSETGVWLTAP